MKTNAYILAVASHMDRLQIFKQVFTQHIATCEAIERGNCLAGDTTHNLHGYLLRNLARFMPFTKEFMEMHVPDEYSNFHTQIANSISAYQVAMTQILSSLSGADLDHDQFQLGVSEQQRALASINFDYFDIIRYRAED